MTTQPAPAEPAAQPTPDPAPTAPTAPEPVEPVRLPDDHPLVKTLAAQKDEIRALKERVASSTEGAKTAEERLAALEERTAKAERLALVKSVQAAHGISDDDADLYLTGPDKDTLERQAKGLAARAETAKRNGNHVPREGTTPKATATDERAVVQALFGSGG